jgi:pre-mRNA-processing factor 39
MVICTFEEGLKFIPVSTDLWLHYCIWKVEHCPPQDARELFTRATASSGQVYSSNLLWDKFLDFEKSQKNFEGMEKIFGLLLSFPTNKLYEYYSRFKNFIDTQYKDQEELKKSKKDEAVHAYEKVCQENNKRKNFEQAIKRSNFSNKPLDTEQVSNWRKYLEFEEKEGDLVRVKLLFERCIVPCCYYSEFWVRYADFLEKTEGVQASRELYQRANKDFLSKRPEVFVAQGIFEETHGCFDEARKLYEQAYEQVAPGLIDALLRHAHLERREKSLERADLLFSRALDVSFNSGDSACIVFVTGEYCRFLNNSSKNLEKTLEIYQKSLEKASDQKSLYFLYISALKNIENNQERLERIRKVFEFGLQKESRLMENDQLELWVAFVDFMRRFWKDFEEVKDVEVRFRKCFHHQNVMCNDFKNRCGIKRMKKNDALEYPEPIKFHKN